MPPSDDTALVSIARPDSEIAALRIKAALDDAGIPCIVRSNLDTAYDGLYVPQKGFGDVLVSSEFASQARALIADL